MSLKPICILLLYPVLLTGCGSCAPAPPPVRPAVHTIVQDDAELLHRSPEQIAGDLDDMKAAGVDWIRVTAGWGVIEAARGAFDWAPLDQLAVMTRSRGLRLDIDIAFPRPDWADWSDYPDFATAVASRYPDAAAFTIWNEPNLDIFLAPQSRAVAIYRRMIRAAVPRVKAAAPHALVLIGATTSLASSATRTAPLPFLRALTCCGPPLPGDGWSHHPYTGELAPWQQDPDPTTVRMGDLDRLTSELHRLRDRFVNPMPVYVTEYGDQTNPPDPTWNITPAEQARRLAEAERIARSNPDVRSTSQFLIRDLPERPGSTLSERWRDYQSGLRFEDGRPKPAFAAFALPLTADRAGPGRVRFWGYFRAGGTDPRIEVQDGDMWRTLTVVHPQRDRTFTVTVDADPTATFRLTAGDRHGAPLHGALAP
jgi:hypothetical protein